VSRRIVPRDHAIARDGDHLAPAHDRGAEGASLARAEAFERCGNRFPHDRGLGRLRGIRGSHGKKA
jgi:hypothetical protein